jgi:ATP-dependent protease HslVU (ClpYQ) peptidase subunit
LTTIAYKDGALASDSQCTNGNRTMFRVKKVFKTQSFLIGVAGPAELIDPFIGWFLEAEEETCEDGCTPMTFHFKLPPELPSRLPDSELEALVICKNSLTVWHLQADGTGVELGRDVIAALGTGDQLAIGAMEAGASSSEAVAIAIRHDAFSGGDIQTIS